MSTIVDSLRRDHRNMDQLLKILEQEIAVFDRAERPDFDVLGGIVDYFGSYPACCHHPIEDLVFAALKESDPDRAAAITDTEAEHEQASQRLEEFAGIIEDIMNEQEIPRAVLNKAVADFVAFERRHMEIEEQELFPAALVSLTAEDWARLDAKVTNDKDPLFDPKVEARYRRLVERLSRWEREDQAERMWVSQGR